MTDKHFRLFGDFLQYAVPWFFMLYLSFLALRSCLPAPEPRGVFLSRYWP